MVSRYIFLLVFFGSFAMYNTSCHGGEGHTFIIGARPYYGFIIRHSGRLAGLTTSNPFGIEADVAWQFISEKSWYYCFCYPRVGLFLQYNDFGRPDLLGRSYSLVPYVEPLIRGENRFHGSFRFGMGPAWVSHIYHPEKNPENLFFSSHISFLVLMGLGLNFRITPALTFRAMGQFNHISNGGKKNPNVGINYPVIMAGVEYHLRPKPFPLYTRDRNIQMVDYCSRWDFYIFGTGKTAIKGRQRYPVFGLNAGYARVIGRQSAILAGAEYAWDNAEKEVIDNHNALTGQKKVDHKYMGALIGHELILGRFSFGQQAGFYLYAPFPRKNWYYQRFYLHVYANNNLLAGISLKTHTNSADFLDFRIGYSIERLKRQN